MQKINSQQASRLFVFKHDNWLTKKEAMPITAVWQKWRFSASYDSFVGKQKVALRIKFSGGRQFRAS